MSDSVLALITALAAALIAYFGSYFSRLRSEYSLRQGAMQVVRTDLASALAQIGAALHDEAIWPPWETLPPQGWDTHRAELVSQLSESSWEQVRQTVVELELADAWAKELRDANTQWSSKFGAHLEECRGEIESSVVRLSNAKTGAKSKFRFGVAFGGMGLAALAVAVFLSFTSGPALSESSLESGLRAEIPAAGRTICDQNTELKGAYRCTVDLPACSGRLEASTDKPSCPLNRIVYGVNTDGHCFAATKKTFTSQQSGGWQMPKRLRKLAIVTGCAKG